MELIKKETKTSWDKNRYAIMDITYKISDDSMVGEPHLAEEIAIENPEEFHNIVRRLTIENQRSIEKSKALGFEFYTVKKLTLL